jgi:hypothetical protein
LKGVEGGGGIPSDCCLPWSRSIWKDALLSLDIEGSTFFNPIK